MDNIELRIAFNNRAKSTWSLTNNTTKQEFEEHIRAWTNTLELKDYFVQYEDPTTHNKILLDANKSHFLAEAFNSVRTLSVTHPLTAAHNFVNIFIEQKLHSGIGQFNASSSVTCSEEPILSPSLQSECDNFFRGLQARGEDLLNQGTNFYRSIHQDDLTMPEQMSQSERHDTDSGLTTTAPDNSNSDVKYISMIHDVSPESGRMRYFSDGVPKRSSKERKTTTTRKRSHGLLPGVKSPEQKNQHIWPIIRIPPFVDELIRINIPVVLLVASVIEEKLNDERIWRLHALSEFRQPGCDEKSIGTNPIQLTLSHELVKHGQFTMQVILTKKPGLVGVDPKGLEFHRLAEETVQKLHLAEHNGKFLRLGFILCIQGARDMSTFGLSDFMNFKPKNEITPVAVQSNTCSACKKLIKPERRGKKRPLTIVNPTLVDSDSSMTEE